MRWINPDSAGTVDGLNLYQFVGGNPVNSVDMVGFARTRSTIYIDRDFPEDNDPIQHLNARFVSFIGLGGTIQRIAQNIQGRNGGDFMNSLVVGADKINGRGGGGAQFQDRMAKKIDEHHAAHLTPGRINPRANLYENEYTELSDRLGHTQIQPKDVNWYIGRTIDHAQSDVLGQGLLANINFDQGVTRGNLNAVRAIQDVFVTCLRSQLNSYNVTNLEGAELNHEVLQSNSLDIFVDYLKKESTMLQALQRGVKDFYSPLATENGKEITHISVPERIPMSLSNITSYTYRQRKQKLIARIKEQGYHPYRLAFTYRQRKQELIAQIKEQGYHPSYSEKVRIFGIAA